MSAYGKTDFCRANCIKFINRWSGRAPKNIPSRCVNEIFWRITSCIRNERADGREKKTRQAFVKRVDTNKLIKDSVCAGKEIKTENRNEFSVRWISVGAWFFFCVSVCYCCLSFGIYFEIDFCAAVAAAAAFFFGRLLSVIIPIFCAVCARVHFVYGRLTYHYVHGIQTLSLAVHGHFAEQWADPFLWSFEKDACRH